MNRTKSSKLPRSISFDVLKLINLLKSLSSKDIAGISSISSSAVKGLISSGTPVGAVVTESRSFLAISEVFRKFQKTTKHIARLLLLRVVVVLACRLVLVPETARFLWLTPQ